MYKAIIADDERKVRTAIVKLGDWERMGIQIVSEAMDGDQLCELADDEEPDIIVTDMRMPGLCGADLIRSLSNRHKDTKLIIVSGYVDFEYTKQAIAARAIDYILKPVSKDNLNEALKNAVIEIQNHRLKQLEIADLQIKLNETLPLLSENLLHKLLEEGQYGKHEILSSLGVAENDQLELATVAVIKMQNAKQIAEEKYNGQSDLLYSSVLNIVNEVIAGQGKAIRKNPNEIVMLFYSDATRLQLYSRLERLIIVLQQYLQIKTLIGVGRNYPDYRDLKLSLREARAVLMQMDLTEESRISFYEDIVHFTYNQSTELKTERLLAAAIKSGNLPLISQMMESYYEEFARTEHMSLHKIQNLGRNILHILESLVDFVETKDEFISRFVLLKDRMEQELSLDRLNQSVSEFLADISVYMRSCKKETQTFYDIRTYVEQNYHLRISLHDISGKFFLSREYISKRFKEEFGVNFLEYLTTLKIDKSKALLLENRKVQEIVSMLSFNDESHFSKVFKKYVGVTPKDFRSIYIAAVDDETRSPKL
ncbi:response regulator [Cohnella silvisoli]|uniref:Response regulator n=1 Tax=Cohnella silvisoli TaxID=2873699 RepID=A0ABV1KLA5_9BACL|nr:response regulator [Cohnella silvisoli]MCD9020768.1 response regulator [Cohnella silvisoli]